MRRVFRRDIVRPQHFVPIAEGFGAAVLPGLAWGMFPDRLASPRWSTRLATAPTQPAGGPGRRWRNDQLNTYSPGPPPSTGYLLLPIGGGDTIGPACLLDQAAQSIHHDSAVRSAACDQSSALAG